MRILLVGAGGVGSSTAAIAVRRKFVECLVVADYDLARATAVVDRLGDPRLVAARLDATDEAAVRDALIAHGATALLNATDPGSSCRCSAPRWPAARPTWTWRCRCRHRTPTPHERTGVKLGDEQFALDDDWRRPASWPWWASGSSRGSPTCSPATPRTTCSPRSTSWVCATARPAVGATSSRRLLDLDDDRGVPQPAGDLGARARLVHDPAVQRAEVFDFPDGIGPVECVNVEHEEVLLMPRWVDARAGDVQVRARLVGDRGAADTARARTTRRPSRCGWATCGCRRARWWPRACPTRRRSARR